MVACSKLRKHQCISTCEWTNGKGCKKKDCPAGKEYNVLTKRCKNIPVLKVKPIVNIKHHSLIDSGTYGCVMKPVVDDSKYIMEEYMKYTDASDSDISKLFKSGKKYFNDELKSLMTVHKIDPHGVFTVRLKGANKISKTSLSQSNSTLSCLGKSKPYYYQIILEDGGIKVSSTYTISYGFFLEHLERFVKGLLLMQENGIVHRDIKPANVLISQTKINLIDWGLETQWNKVYNVNAMGILGYKNYIFYPPEFFIAYLLLSNSEVNRGKEDAMKSILEEIEYHLQKNGFYDQIFLINNQELTQKYKKGIKEFIDNALAKKLFKMKKLFTKEITLQADVFSIGHVICSLNKAVNFTSVRDKFFVNYIYEKCIDPNPFTRITMKTLHTIIKNELLDNSARMHKKSKGGAMFLNSTYCDKAYHDFSQYKSPPKH